MWSRAPLWRLIIAIRRSLLKPWGMFQTTAGAVHWGVASPWTPDLEKLCILTQVPQHHHWLIPTCYMYRLTPYHLISMFSHVPTVFIWPLGGLVLFRLCFQALWERTRSLRVPGTADWWLLPESFHETETPNRNRFSLMGPAGLCKRRVSTWPQRWHFLNVKIRLQGNAA